MALKYETGIHRRLGYLPHGHPVDRPDPPVERAKSPAVQLSLHTGHSLFLPRDRAAIVGMPHSTVKDTARGPGEAARGA